MKILHTPYRPAKLGVEMVAGETLMLFHMEEQPLVELIVAGMLEMLGEDDHDQRATLMEVYEHVRAHEGKEVN